MRWALNIRGSSWGLWLALLTMGAIAVALAIAVGMGTSPAAVFAHPCEPSPADDMHEDFQGKPVPCSVATHQKTHEHSIEVDGGRFRDMTFKAYVPSEGKYYENANDSIVITFHRSFDLPESIPSTGSLITVDDSGDDAPVDVTGATVDGKKLRLLDDFSGILNAGEYVTITIRAGAEIETPETPQGFDNFEGEKPYEVFITFVDGDPPNEEKKADDRNFVIVKNPIDSTVPNTAVRVELATHAETNISTADDISVDFSGPSAESGFDLPGSLATSRIKVFYMDDGSEKSFSPSEVQIEGERVIFSVPTDNDENQISFTGDYRIEFSRLARVKTPFSAGIKTIRISSTVDGDEEDIIEAVVRRTTTVNPQGGPRGSEFTLEGKGYAPGTVTVYHDADGDETIDAGETLASVKTVRGAFRIRLTAQGNPGEEEYRVRARDSEGDDVSVRFDIRSAMSFEPNPVGLGSSLKVLISDWEIERNEVVAVQIAGQQVFVADAVEYDNCIDHPDAARRDSQGNVNLTVDVPPDIPPGEQTVSVYDHYQLDYTDADGNAVEDTKPACHEKYKVTSPGGLIGPLHQAIITDDPIAINKATVEIVAQGLTLSRSEAVRGQRVTITGSGFSRHSGGEADIKKATINGDDVVEDLSLFEVGTNGKVALTVTVPMGARDGVNEVQVVGWDNTLGRATLTVPAPSLNLSPAQTRTGSTVIATGSGFVANHFYQVTYGDGGDVDSGEAYVGSGQADAWGNFRLPFEVPLTARIGRTYAVAAVSVFAIDEESKEVRAEASHTIPPGSITVSPESVLPGDAISISGENLPAFALVSSVRIGGRDATPVPNLSAGGDGAVEFVVTVPQIELGEQAVRVEASGVVLTYIINIAEPPRSGPPSRVFHELIRAGVLLRVWYLERSTQVWSFFDPAPEFAEFSNLEHVPPGEVAWIRLSAPYQFQGENLVAGWNPVPIE